MRNNIPTEFMRNCPSCGIILYYKTSNNLSGAVRKNSYCDKCKISGDRHPLKGKHHTTETKKKISLSRIGQLPTIETKKKMSIAHKGQRSYIRTEKIRQKMSEAKKGEKSAWFGKKHSLETRQRMSASHMGKNAVWFGKTLSAEHKEKLRMARLKFVKDKYKNVYYNPNACLYFDKLEKEQGWNGYYATKNSEYQVGGYSVDYYEPNLNVVIEYDEPHHYNLNGTLKSKDRKRQNFIMNRLNCQFLRYNELIKKLK